MDPSSPEPTPSNQSQPRRRTLVSRQSIKEQAGRNNLANLTQHLLDSKEARQQPPQSPHESSPDAVAPPEFESAPTPQDAQLTPPSPSHVEVAAGQCKDEHAENSSLIHRILHRGSNANQRPSNDRLNSSQHSYGGIEPDRPPSTQRLTIDTSASSRHHPTSASRFSQDDTTVSTHSTSSASQQSNGISRIFSGFRSKDSRTYAANTPAAGKGKIFSKPNQYSQQAQDQAQDQAQLQHQPTFTKHVSLGDSEYTDDEFIVVRHPASNPPPKRQGRSLTTKSAEDPDSGPDNDHSNTNTNTRRPPTLSPQSPSSNHSSSPPTKLPPTSSVSPIPKQLDLSLLDPENDSNNLNTTVPLHLTPRRTISLNTDTSCGSPDAACPLSPTSVVSDANPPSPTSSTSSLRARRAFAMRSRFTLNTPTTTPPTREPFGNAITPMILDGITDLTQSPNQKATLQTPSLSISTSAPSPRQLETDNSKYTTDTAPIPEVDDETSHVSTSRPNSTTPQQQTSPRPTSSQSALELLKQQMQDKQKRLATTAESKIAAGNEMNRTPNGEFMPRNLESTRNLTIDDLQDKPTFRNSRLYTFGLDNAEPERVEDSSEFDHDDCLVVSPRREQDSVASTLGLPDHSDDEDGTVLSSSEQEYAEFLNSSLKSAHQITKSNTRTQDSMCEVQILLTQSNRREEGDIVDENLEDVVFQPDEKVQFFIYNEDDSDLDDDGDRPDNDDDDDGDDGEDASFLKSPQDEIEDDEEQKPFSPKYPQLFTVSHYAPSVKAVDAPKLLTSHHSLPSNLTNPSATTKSKQHKKVSFHKSISSQLVVPCNLLSFPRLNSKRQPFAPYPGYPPSP